MVSSSVSDSGGSKIIQKFWRLVHKIKTMHNLLLRSAQKEPSSIFGDLDDEAWFEVLVRSINEPIISGVILPGFPKPDVQATIGGSSGRITLQEAFNFLG